MPKSTELVKPFVERYYSNFYKRELNDSPDEVIDEASKYIGKLAREVPAGGVYLGIGAGRGHTEAKVWHTNMRHLNVHLLDIAKRKPVLIKNGKPGDHLPVVNHTGDAQDLKEFNDESVDLASCVMSQDFYDNRRAATRNAWRVLKPGAKFVLYLHHPEMFRVGLKENADYYDTVKPEIKDFWNKLLRRNKLFKNKDDLTRHYMREGFSVLEVSEHTPAEKEDKDNFWWKVVLEKPRRKV